MLKTKEAQRACQTAQERRNSRSCSQNHINSFRHLRTDDLTTGIWRSAALKCKVFCWLARRWRLPTSEQRFRHSLSPSATCLSCPEDEDIDTCCSYALEQKKFWTSSTETSTPVALRASLISSSCMNTPTRKPRSTPTSLGPFGKDGMLSL
jgi:hypothetical protein